MSAAKTKKPKPKTAAHFKARASRTKTARKINKTALPLIAETLPALTDAITSCRLCPRLVRWREHVAKEKRKAFRDWDYWGKPVPGFGDPDAKLVIVGLAPAAHGGNRTGRIFTGDMSGDFLFAGLHRVGIANQETSKSRDDGLAIKGTYILAAVRCAPPDNAPSPAETRRCARYLDNELELLKGKKVILALGIIAWTAYFHYLARHGVEFKKRPDFGHGAHVELPDGTHLVASYHVSAQNTLTGTLTPSMFDQVLRKAMALAGLTLALFAFVGCSNNPPPTRPAIAQSAPIGTFVGDAGAVADSDSGLDSGWESGSGSGSDAGWDAGWDAVAAVAERRAPKKVLHIGDSMVGGYGGLTKALEAHYKDLGSKFVRDWQVSLSIQTFARDKHFAEMLKAHDPDLVIITLGANDLLVPFPSSLASFIQSIAKKTEGRACYWLPPVPWRKDTGLIEVIKSNAAPCKVLDPAGLTIARGPDGIHPTDKGGQQWADAFFKAFEP